MVCKLLNDPTQTQRSIAIISGISRRTVARIRSKLTNAGISNSNAINLTDVDLGRIFGTAPTPPHMASRIDWLTLHDDMQKRDMTLQLAWEEYRSQNFGWRH